MGKSHKKSRRSRRLSLAGDLAHRAIARSLELGADEARMREHIERFRASSDATVDELRSAAVEPTAAE